MTAPKWYDLTISQEKIKFATLVETLDAISERYVIGDEIGGMTGYEHWQIRLVLKKSCEYKNQIEFWAPFGHVSQTHVRNFDYCEKEGNFFRSWEIALRDYANLKLLPWQEQLLDLYEKQGDREIIVIVDELGKHGKSWFRKYLQVTHRGEYIPPLADYKDLMRVCMEKSGRGYVFDLPRADTIKQKKGMWMMIETVKDGYLFEDRYSFREKWIKPPKVLVFSNEEPPWESLSKDRWNVYTFEQYGGETVLLPYEWNYGHE